MVLAIELSDRAGAAWELLTQVVDVPALWERPDFQKMWLEMVQWSMGLIPADATPQPKPGK